MTSAFLPSIRLLSRIEFAILNAANLVYQKVHFTICFGSWFWLVFHFSENREGSGNILPPEEWYFIVALSISDPNNL